MMKLHKLLICDFGAKQKWGLFFGVLLFAFSVNAQATEVGSVCFKNTCFRPEIARTPIEKQRGLMDRTALGASEGMLFVYDHEVRPDFWMKNMRIPLDFIWLDREGRAVDLDEAVPACPAQGACSTIGSSKPVQYVLEIAAGSIQKIGIKIGDQADIKNEK